MNTRNPGTKPAALVRSLLLASLTLLLGACGGSIRFSGRVVPGPVGVASVVSLDDERLSGPGLAGVDVTLLRASGQRGGAVVAHVVSDESGNFEVVLGRGQHPGGAVFVRVEGENVFDARSKAYLPRGGQALLCTAIEREPRKDQ